MKRHFGFVLIMMSSVSSGEEITLSVRAAELVGQPGADAATEIELLVKETQGYSADDIEGVRTILEAFTQMFASFAAVMCNPNNPIIAANGISSILSNTFKVILTLGKNKNCALDDTIAYSFTRHNNAYYTLEAMEKELVSKQQTNEDQTTREIFTHFAGMIGNFANIVADPHNPNVLGSSIANLLAGMINIAVTATRKGLLTPDTTQAELEAFFLSDTQALEELGVLVRHHAMRARMLRAIAGYSDNAVA